MQQLTIESVKSTKSGKSLGVKARDGLSSWTPKQQMKAA